MDNSIIQQAEKPIKPCKKCGSLEKTKDGKCRPCSIAYNRMYYAKNADILNAQNRENRIINGDKIRADDRIKHALNPEKKHKSNKKWRMNNEEHLRDKNKKWYIENPERAKYNNEEWIKNNPEKKRESDKLWRDSNPERVHENHKSWNERNPHKKRTYEQNRRARKNVSGGKLSTNIVEKLMKLQNGKCPCCKQQLGNDYHLDHIIPLALGGTNTDNNVQLMIAACNMKKHAKDPIDFMQELGFLL